jgi:hypothetical protein
MQDRARWSHVRPDRIGYVSACTEERLGKKARPYTLVENQRPLSGCVALRGAKIFAEPAATVSLFALCATPDGSFEAIDVGADAPECHAGPSEDNAWYSWSDIPFGCSCLNEEGPAAATGWVICHASPGAEYDCSTRSGMPCGLACRHVDGELSIG